MDELELEFELHPQLAADCIVLGDFPISRLLLLNDANYPWFILVPRRAGATEIYHLSDDEQCELIKESSFLASNLADSFAARKMNVASLGNMVPQLHLHHIVRYETDKAWPGPVWGKVPAEPYTAEQIHEIRRKLEALMSGELEFVPEEQA
ncbi:HIT domain-containing protein [Neptuniibacter sp. SY11_33]|uniref:HIT domain-containing protein n=2 Tax=unclassified Neptuniibacter TaxID=2630693 RepID=UPI0039F6ED36